MKIFKSRRVVISGQICPATIYVDQGKISRISTSYEPGQSDLDTGLDSSQVYDAGDLVIMPGVVDSHVHVNEPGRTQWEGFETASRAAAAGGITTIVDMPLNSIPTTVSLEAFKTKLAAARDQCHVDVAFWGGVVPGNQTELVPMLQHGICGFKCFMIHSGIDDFPFVTESDIRAALSELKATNSVLLFHAEVEQAESETKSGEVTEYKTFLESRPQSMEVEAIKLVCQLAAEYRVRCHIVHLSAAEALPVLKAARSSGAPVTIETTHHYLCLHAEDVPQMATQYKCCPPIRNEKNKEVLWEAVKSGDIDMVVSDHSPCTADLKLLDTGDFVNAWGGVSSVQFGLSLFWTEAERRGFTLIDVVNKLCKNTAALSGLSDRKGDIEVGLDADLVIWDPQASFTIETTSIYHKNKVTPYLGRSLRGKVHTTVVRGNTVYDQGRFSDQPMGELVLLKVKDMK